MISAKKMLLQAAADIEQYGLAKGSFLESSDRADWRTAPACALGAIARAGDMVDKVGLPLVDTDAVTECPAVHRLARVLKPAEVTLTKLKSDVFTRYSVVIAWSDAEERTAAEVAAKMREAAE